jgi:hypothetical protein
MDAYRVALQRKKLLMKLGILEMTAELHQGRALVGGLPMLRCEIHGVQLICVSRDRGFVLAPLFLLLERGRA